MAGPALVILAGSVVCNCARAPETSFDSALPIDFANLASHRIECSGEWRDTKLVPAGSNVANLGPVWPESALRLAFVPKGMLSDPPVARAYAGSDLISEVRPDNPLLWNDQYISLATYAGKPCSVVFTAETDLFVAQCELTHPPATQPNILVFLIDALRPDHLGCYGYERDTSPCMDALACDGIRFNTAISQSSWTRPAVASLLTSTYPAEHAAKDRADVMRQDLPTLEGILRDAGYETQGFMSNPSCLPTWGLGNDFTRYVDVDSDIVDPGKDAVVVDEALAALRNVAGRPWFLYVHTIGPHEPYEPPSPYDRRFVGDPTSKEEAERTRQCDLYDGEIAFSDAQFGRLVDELQHLGLYDNTLIVVLSDHGEEFWEHGGTGHGTTLYDEQIRIPLLLKLPHSAGRGTQVDDIVEIIDIAPTVLAFADLTPPTTFQGISLAPLVNGEPMPARPAYASLFLERRSEYAGRNARWKYLHDVAGRSTRWYDLSADPLEQRPLSEPPPDQAALARFASRIAVGGETGLHILVTGSLREEHTIEGTVWAGALGEFGLHYLANNGEVNRTPEGLSFRITTSPGPDSPLDIVSWHEESAQQNNAHLRIALENDSPIRVSLRFDGGPAPESMVFLGPHKTPQALDDTELVPGDLAAGPQLFDPSALPRRLAVYLWYVPGAETVADQDLDPAMAEALRNLGYL